jgi:hypothetical protein
MSAELFAVERNAQMGRLTVRLSRNIVHRRVGLTSGRLHCHAVPADCEHGHRTLIGAHFDTCSHVVERLERDDGVRRANVQHETDAGTQRQLDFDCRATRKLHRGIMLGSAAADLPLVAQDRA